MSARNFVLIFLIIIFRYSLSFNINTNAIIVYSDPEDSKEDFFGYSIVLYNLPNKTGVYIGAPKSSQYSEKPNFAKSKFIFNCELGEPCIKIPLYNGRETSEEMKNVNKNSWMGGSMDINHNYGRVVVCEPRWISEHFSEKGIDDFYMHGNCYWFKTESPHEFKCYDPINSLFKQYSKQANFGISVYLVPDEKKMVLGAPSLSFKGTSILYEDIVPNSSGRVQRRHIPDDYFGNRIIARNQNEKDTYFGYSSAAGYFYDNTKSKLYYVSGAPRLHYHGAIKVYQFGDNLKTIEQETIKNGTQCGEYFGSSLTVGDLNNDGFDDLIVGAPFHTSTLFNEGRIYIFLGSFDGLLRAEATIEENIFGMIPNAQFGTTVQFLGDINDDGFGDVAISAPYELENSGVVYIYRGFEFGLKQKFTQKIIGRNILPEIRGFGISISRAVDIDNNFYPDFAVGAHLSGHTVILRTKPVINIFHKTVALHKPIDISTTSFQVNVCFWFNASKKISEPIKITRNVIVDEELQRGRLSDNKPIEIITLQDNNVKNCENLTVKLMPGIEDVHKPITIKTFHNYQSFKTENKIITISNSSVPEILDAFSNCSHNCPVEDIEKNSSKNMSLTQIEFSLSCGSDNICNSSLEFNQFLNKNTDGNSFTVGSSELITLYTIIENLGENSYGTKLRVTIPELIDVKQMSKNCEQLEIKTVILCDLLTDPLMTNKTETVELHLDMFKINTGKYEEPIFISTAIETNSYNNNNSTKKSLKIDLKFQADMKITGESKERSYLYGNSKTNFENIFQIEKLGVSTIDLTEIEISIPYKIQTKLNNQIEFIEIDSIINNSRINSSKTCHYLNSIETTNIYFNPEENNDENIIVSNAEIEDYLKNRILYISCNRNGVICRRITCFSGPFVLNKEMGFIEIKMRSNISAIKDIFDGKDAVLLTTNASIIVKKLTNFIQTGNEPDFVNVHTLFIGENVFTVPAWIILLAVLIGILLVVLLSYALIKAGFFKRKTKMELENLKKSANEQEERRFPDDNAGSEELVEKNIDELLAQDNSDVFVDDE